MEEYGFNLDNYTVNISTIGSSGEFAVKVSGVESLNNDINNFKKGTVFSGKISGKLQHTYLYTDNIYIDKDGNEVGDSIDLSQCDYLLDTIEKNLLANFDSDIEFINNNMMGEYEE